MSERPSFDDIFAVMSAASVGDMALATVAKGEVKRFDTVRRRKDGRFVDVSVTVSPVRDSTGKVVSISKVARDNTERRRAEVSLARAKDEVEAANRELEAFSYSVSHDLRAPLRAIRSFAQMLDEDVGATLDDASRDHLRRVIAATGRMTDLVEALLDLSRIGRVDIARSRVDLGAVAAAVIDEHRTREPARVVDVAIERDLVVEADPRLMRVMFDNLIGNAWKFTAGRERAHVVVGARRIGAERAFFVQDDGAGFDVAKAANLFVPFQRMHGAEFAGTGIGLATVRRIVERHRGRIWAESTVGAGTTMLFTLPL
jgi:light-regulated signal transduction histidine kinase (bacteriophytochrome)